MPGVNFFNRVLDLREKVEILVLKALGSAELACQQRWIEDNKDTLQALPDSLKLPILHAMLSQHLIPPTTLSHTISCITVNNETPQHMIEFMKMNCALVGSLTFSGNSASFAEGLCSFSVTCSGALHSLILSGCKFVNDNVMKVVAKNCTKLCELSLDLTRITDASLNEIASNCTNLTALTLRACSVTDAGIQKIASSCFLLTSLNLSKCHKVSDRGASIIGTYLPLLRKLCLYECNVRDAGVLAIGRGCPNLQDLDLGRCHAIRDNCIIDISPLLSSLSSICLSGCRLLSDLSLVHLSLHCKNLCSVEIDGCKFTDEGLYWLATQCPSLRHINLRDISQITDLSIENLALNCPLLEIINIKQCNNITSRSISVFISYFPQLKELNLLGYLKVSAADVEQLQNNRPNLFIAYQ